MLLQKHTLLPAVALEPAKAEGKVLNTMFSFGVCLGPEVRTLRATPSTSATLPEAGTRGSALSVRGAPLQDACGRSHRTNMG